MCVCNAQYGSLFASWPHGRNAVLKRKIEKRKRKKNIVRRRTTSGNNVRSNAPLSIHSNVRRQWRVSQILCKDSKRRDMTRPGGETLFFRRGNATGEKYHCGDATQRDCEGLGASRLARCAMRQSRKCGKRPPLFRESENEFYVAFHRHLVSGELVSPNCASRTEEFPVGRKI